MGMNYYCLLLLCVFLCIACYYDYRFCRIPNWLNALIFVLGVMQAALTGGIPAIIQYFGFGVLMMTALFPLFRIGTVGGGDVKLYGVCCGFFPKDKILWFLFFSLLFAVIFSLIRFARKRDLKERFSYLLSYVWGVADSGEWKFYWSDLQEKKKAGIRMAGPILVSVLLFWGGIY